MEDQAVLDACPDFISIGGLLKATPSTEGGERFLYLEASNEQVDHENEIVLQKALTDSADYYMRHGNVDISHFSLVGAQRGMKDYMEYEIGKPVEVRVGGTGGKSTFVKAQLYRGESAMAMNANRVWDSMTRQTPPARWYPSVGGAVLAKSVRLDPATKNKVAVVEKVRWSNLALDRTPVNKSVPEVSATPIGVFAKSLGGFVVKGLAAGYGTDAAALAGGGALRKQSLDGAMYYQHRDRLAEHVRTVGKAGKNPGIADMHGYCLKDLGLSHDESAELVERFMSDLKKGLKKRRSKS